MGKKNSKSLVLRDSSTFSTIKSDHDDSESNTESNSNRTVTRVDTSTLSLTDSSLSKENLLGLLLELLENTKSSSNQDAHPCTCDNCEKSHFLEYRYKCLICDDYDLCGSCFEKRKINKTHQINHPLVRFDVPNELFGMKFENSEINLTNFVNIFKNETHDDVKCDCCQSKPIKGLRFKCDTCNDYDLCFKCFQNKNTSLNHSFDEHPLIVQGKKASLLLDVDDIELLTELGSGAFGTVHKAKLKSLQKVVACKIITIKSDQDLIMRLLGMDPITLYKSYLQELNAYNELKGVNILKMFGHSIQIIDKSAKLMIITEFMGKGSLTSLLENEKDMSFRRKFDIACDIAAGMARIHEHNFIHRDIRPDNILIADNYTAKIGDMGIAKLIQTDKHTLIGCRAYMPPEFYTGNYDQKLDVFTFGLTLNIIYNGSHTEEHPIRIKKEAEIMTEIIRKFVNPNPVERPTSKNISENFRIIKKVVDGIIFKRMNFGSYITMSTEKKNEIFTLIVTKMNEKNLFQF